MYGGTVPCCSAIALQIHSLIREQHKHSQPNNHGLVDYCMNGARLAFNCIKVLVQGFQQQHQDLGRWSRNPEAPSHMWEEGTHPQCIIAGPDAEHDPR